MNAMDKSLPELLSMLRTAEQNVKSKGKSILMVNNGKKLNKRPTKRVGRCKGMKFPKERKWPKARKLPNPNLLFLL